MMRLHPSTFVIAVVALAASPGPADARGPRPQTVPAVRDWHGATGVAGDRALGVEGYRITIGRTVVISARTATGVFYGTRTLLQLRWRRRTLPRGTARDWPRYPERGLMIDLDRRRYPEAWIETEINQMAALKLNMLHLHLTDDERCGGSRATAIPGSRPPAPCPRRRCAGSSRPRRGPT